LQIDPATLPAVLWQAGVLALATTLTKIATGLWAARRAGVDRRAAFRAGVELVPRGEFSIVIAGLGAALNPQLGPLAAAYVLLLAIVGPILARLVR
jgi:CPA2 family monovalent cation:H+ antiporter-2